MILRRKRRSHAEDLAILQRATAAKVLERWVPEKQWGETLSITKVLPDFFPEDFKIRLRYTYAPIRVKYRGLRRENAVLDYFKTWKEMIPSSLERLRLLKIPHITHIEAGWELPAIRAVLRRNIPADEKARAIIRLAGSGLAKHKMGTVERIPYEVIMAHFAHPDAAAAYDIVRDEVLFPSPSAVRAMGRGEHRAIPDLVNTLAHEGMHAYLNTKYRLASENDLEQILLNTADEAIASAVGDLVAHKIAGGPKPRKSYADWYLRIYGIPLHREAFKHIYWQIVKNAGNAEDAAQIGIAAAKKFGIHVKPLDRI